MADKMKSFFSRLGKKDAADTSNNPSNQWARMLALVRGGDANTTSVELTDENCPLIDENAVSDMCLAIQQQQPPAAFVTAFRVRNRSVEPSIEFIASLCSTTQTLAELRLSNCGITDHESNCIVAALLNNRSIRALAVDHNNITSTEPWGQLLKLSKALESLDLSHNRVCVVKGSDESMALLAAGLVGNRRLRELFLAGNGVAESSVRMLVQTVQQHGDEMALRSVDLATDPALSQACRDSLAAALARPPLASPSGGIGLRKPRTADDPDGGIITPSRPRAATAMPSNGGGGGGAAAVVSKENLQVLKPQEQQAAADAAGDDDDVSNYSFSTYGGGEGGSGSPLSADQAAARAQKLQKLREMKQRHQNELRRLEGSERDMREQLARAQGRVAELEAELASAKTFAAAAVAAQEQSAAANGGGSSNSAAEAKLREALQAQLAAQEQRALQLQQAADRVAAEHGAELRRRDAAQQEAEREHEARIQELTALVATFGEKGEQSRHELQAMRRELDKERQARASDVAAAQQAAEERVERLRAEMEQEREQLQSRARAAEAKAAAAAEQSESAAQAASRLEAAATAEIATLRTQLEAALSLSTLRVGGNAASFAQLLEELSSLHSTARDAEIQTDLLPEVKAGASPVSSAPAVPSMDISSVTRFKMPPEYLEQAHGGQRRGSGDSFVGSDEGSGGKGRFKWLPKSKWVPDDSAPACQSCKAKFGLFAASRHHCRVCGQCKCDDCCPVHPQEKKRICHVCIGRAQ